MDPKKKEDDVEVVIEPAPEKGAEKTVVIDLEEKGKEKTGEKAEDKKDDELKKALSRTEYLNRQFEKGLKNLSDLAAKLQAVPQKSAEIERAPKQPTREEIDKIAEDDWQKGVDILAEKKAKEVLLRERLLKEDQDRKARLEQELEDSKKRVFSRYEKIEDEASEEGKMFAEILNEDPTLLTKTNGPEIAMYRMEDRMRDKGITPAPYKKMVDKEVNRFVRAQAGSVSGRQAGASDGSKVTLTHEQIEFCKHNNIPFDKYARTLREIEGDGGISI